MILNSVRNSAHKYVQRFAGTGVSPAFRGTKRIDSASSVIIIMSDGFELAEYAKKFN
jgi:hypothetical protein